MERSSKTTSFSMKDRNRKEIANENLDRDGGKQMDELKETIAYMQKNGGYEPHTHQELSKLKELLLSSKPVAKNVRPMSSSSALSLGSLDFSEELEDGISVLKRDANSHDYGSSRHSTEEYQRKLREMYTFDVPASALPGQVLKVTDPLQSTVMSVKIDEGMTPGERVTFAPESNFKLDHADGCRVVRIAGEEEKLHQIRVESVDADVQHARLPLAQAYARFNKPVTWAMGAEEKLLRELVIERLSASRAA
eukprot:CAMPEP_0172157082 /NCGR_PEP_ID=MMETSP1050-20130122/3585_1 /TAXON_ID=233186 /ORGANISM="Cryptomonas curvata, Strain CCAP979/52" /LENGTH=250 /DNA_ID=CAMNT_0012826255 /DNA_START=89 /DNA_END=838 /DNA_ORIENTATION=+